MASESISKLRTISIASGRNEGSFGGKQRGEGVSSAPRGAEARWASPMIQRTSPLNFGLKFLFEEEYID